MQFQNEVILTGNFAQQAVTATFTRQVLMVPTKDRNGQAAKGEMDIYIKPDLFLKLLLLRS